MFLVVLITGAAFRAPGVGRGLPSYNTLGPVDHHLPSIPLHSVNNLYVHPCLFAKLLWRNWQHEQMPVIK